MVKLMLSWVISTAVKDSLSPAGLFIYIFF